MAFSYVFFFNPNYRSSIICGRRKRTIGTVVEGLQKKVNHKPLQICNHNLISRYAANLFCGATVRLVKVRIWWRYRKWSHMALIIAPIIGSFYFKNNTQTTPNQLLKSLENDFLMSKIVKIISSCGEIWYKISRRLSFFLS